MMTKFDQVKSIHNRAVETHDANALREIPAMLNRWGIKCREKDGQLLWTNLSVPTSVEETIAIGLRYKKKDQTLAEDIFELSKNNPEVVTRHYTGGYQTVRPEYQGTHKLQDVGAESFTTVNTCCLYLGDKMAANKHMESDAHILTTHEDGCGEEEDRDKDRNI